MFCCFINNGMLFSLNNSVTLENIAKKFNIANMSRTF
jgi:hypothetical protein